MARNSERAMLLLNRWQALAAVVAKNRDGDRRGIDRVRGRPPKAAALASAADAEYWRNTLVRELSLKFVELQNPLVEHVKLADLNDQVTQLVRDKLSYEARLLELGGRDYRNSGLDFIQRNSITTLDGKVYYGRAKELIAHKDLIPNAAAESAQRPSRHQLVSRIGGTYFGHNELVLYPSLLEEEAARERALLAARQLNLNA